MNKEKATTFIKDHKVEIGICAGAAVSVALFLITKGKHSVKVKTTPIQSKHIVDIPVPADFSVGLVKDLWTENGYLNAIINDIALEDIGKLGTEFLDSGLIKADATVSMVVGFLNE